MENDSEKKIVEEWNTNYPNMIQKSFNGVYRLLTQLARKNGNQSRIRNYNYTDKQNEKYKSIVELQQQNRRVNNKWFLELHKRAKQIKKLRKYT